MQLFIYITQEVLREESLVNSKEEQEEVRLSVLFWVLAPSLLAHPKIEGREDTKDCSHAQNIMEVPYHIICLYYLMLPQGSDSLL